MVRFIRKITVSPGAPHPCREALPPIFEEGMFKKRRQLLFPGTICQCDCGKVWIIKTIQYWRGPPDFEWVIANAGDIPSHLFSKIRAVRDV